MCLVMTVEPGKGGQTLITDMLAKISELKSYIERKGLEIDIEVDGGINLKTAPRVKKAGANILVAGTAILMASDFKFKTKFKKHRNRTKNNYEIQRKGRTNTSRVTQKSK